MLIAGLQSYRAPRWGNFERGKALKSSQPHPHQVINLSQLNKHSFYSSSKFIMPPPSASLSVAFSLLCLPVSLALSLTFQRPYRIMSVMTVKVSSSAPILLGCYWIMFVFGKPEGKKKAQLSRIAKHSMRHTVRFCLGFVTHSNLVFGSSLAVHIYALLCMQK